MTEIPVSDEFVILLIIVCAAVSLWVLVGLVISLVHYFGNSTSEADFDGDATPEAVLKQAEVTGMKIHHAHGGSMMMPDYQPAYFVEFTCDGKKEAYSVPESIYAECYIGRRGDLVTVDGKFFDFGVGEEIRTDEKLQ